MNTWDINSLNCDKLIIHPNSPKLVKFFEDNIPGVKNIEIEYEKKSFTKAMILRYILLLYSQESDVHNRHSLDWYSKKFEACGYAGFPLSKSRDGYMRFDEKVVDMVLGKNDGVNDMAIAYMGYINKPKWNYLVFLHESMLAFTRDAMGRRNTDVKTSKEYRALYEDFHKLSNEIGHTYEETEEFVNRFYYQIEQSRLALRPEDYSQRLADGDDLRADNPYLVGYSVEPPKFLGDDEEQVRKRLS